MTIPTEGSYWFHTTYKQVYRVESWSVPEHIMITGCRLKEVPDCPNQITLTLNEWYMNLYELSQAALGWIGSSARENTTSSEYPLEGSIWRHKNGRLYKVLMILNRDTTDLIERPPIVAYQDEDGRMYGRRLAKWYESMTEVFKGTK